MLARKDVPINNMNFSVMEISIGEMLPILPRLQGDEANEAQIDIMKKAVLLDGVVMGENLLNIGLASYMKLITEVLQINGLSAKELGKG